jgi:hypothetical protein
VALALGAAQRDVQEQRRGLFDNKTALGRSQGPYASASANLCPAASVNAELSRALLPQPARVH